MLGICRGAQSLNLYFKGKLIKVENHVKKKHVLFDIKYKKIISVNSFHDFGFNKKTLGKGLRPLLLSKDNIIEYIKHEKYALHGIMWHPEREKNINKFDIKLIKRIFK